MSKFKIGEGLSDIDRHLITKEEPEREKITTGSVDDFDITFKKVSWTNSREWKCPFCFSDNSTTERRCGRCHSHRYQFGDIDITYKSPNSRKISSAAEERLKQEYIKKYGNPNVK